MSAPRPPLMPVRTAALMICTRDRPQEIEDCLASCAALERPDGLRIVVCVADNNETPQEHAICRSSAAGLLKERGMELSYGHEPERGYASVRNRALDLALAAGADLAVFIDDDSTAHPRLVAAHAVALHRYRADAILGRIEGLSQRPVEGRRVWKAGTGNVAIRRWVFDPAGGLGLRFDPRLNLLGFEDWEFFGDLVGRGGIIFQSTEPVSISRPTLEAAPTSADRPFDDRLAFAMMEGRNEIAVTRIRHGMAAATVKTLRRHVPLLLRGLSGIATSRNPARIEAARLRVAKARAGFTGLWRPGFERPLARQGTLVETPST